MVQPSWHLLLFIVFFSFSFSFLFFLLFILLLFLVHCFLSVCDCNLFRVWYTSIYLIYTLFIIIFFSLFIYVCVVVVAVMLFFFFFFFCFFFVFCFVFCFVLFLFPPVMCMFLCCCCYFPVIGRTIAWNTRWVLACQTGLWFVVSTGGYWKSGFVRRRGITLSVWYWHRSETEVTNARSWRPKLI